MGRSGGAGKCRDEVPDELVFEILSHLPVKSVGRFRCVCKAWLYLISQPSFVEVHRSRSPPTLYISLSNLVPSGCLFSMKEGTFRRLPQLTKLPELTDGWYNSRSVNGLLCMYQGHDGFRENGSFEALVCNPSTGECMMLPPTAFSDPEKRFRYQDLSIGFDPCTNSYKILRIWTAMNIFHPHYEILTLGSQAWRIMDDVPSGWVDVPGEWWFQDGLCIDGILYWTEFTWASNKLDYAEHSSLIAFHVGEEKFRSIPVPPEAKQWDTGTALFEICGHLVVVEFLEQRLTGDRVQCFLEADVMVIWKLVDSVNGVWSKTKIQMREPRISIAIQYTLIDDYNRTWQCYSEPLVNGSTSYFVAFCDGGKILYIPQKLRVNDDDEDNDDDYNYGPYVVYFDIEKECFWKETISLPPLGDDIHSVGITNQPCNYTESIISLKEICGFEKCRGSL